MWQKVLNISNIDEALEGNENYKPILSIMQAGYDMYTEQDTLGFVKATPEDAANGDYFLHV